MQRLIVAGLAAAGTWQACELSAAEAPSKKPKSLVAATGQKIPIDKSTTYFTGPLDNEGYLDFLAAINAASGDGVALSENAAAPLLDALGPEENPAVMDSVRVALGMPTFAATGDWLVSANSLWKASGGDDADASARQAWFERFNKDYDRVMAQPWTADEFPQMAAWLVQNEKPLKIAAEGVKRPKYYRPLTLANPQDSLMMVLLPDVQQHRSLARQFKARAMLHIGHGRWEAARDDLIAMHRLAEHVGSGHTLIETLVGIAIDSMATAGAQAWLTQPELPADVIAGYREQLAALPPKLEMSVKIDRAERGMGLEFVQSLARGRTNRLKEVINPGDQGGQASFVSLEGLAQAFIGLSIDYPTVMQTMNGQYDSMVAAAKLPTFRERLTRTKVLQEQLVTAAAKSTSFQGVLGGLVGGGTARGEQFAQILSKLLLPAVTQALFAEERYRTNRRLLETGLALAEYRAVNDAYPESLERLVPEYLAEIPGDNFDGQPLRYRTDGKSFTLYSVGRNLTDDGGVRSPQGPNEGDQVLSDPAP